MLILKISNTVLTTLTPIEKIRDNYNLTSGSTKRQIEFLGLRKMVSVADKTRTDFSWNMSPEIINPTTKRPQKERISTSDGKTIECTVFKISFTGATSQSSDMTDKTFYLRVYNANVTISKVFLAIIEEEQMKEAKIDIVKVKNAPEIATTAKAITYKITPTDTKAKEFDGLNKSYVINESSNQLDVCLFNLFTELNELGNPTRFLFQDYYALNPSDVNSEDNTKYSKPTFQDFLSIYQDLVRSDPAIEAGKWQNLIDTEKARKQKLINALDEFKNHLKNFNIRLNLHSTAIENIANK